MCQNDFLDKALKSSIPGPFLYEEDMGNSVSVVGRLGKTSDLDQISLMFRYEFNHRQRKPVLVRIYQRYSTLRRGEELNSIDIAIEESNVRK